MNYSLTAMAPLLVAVVVVVALAVNVILRLGKSHRAPRPEGRRHRSPPGAQLAVVRPAEPWSKQWRTTAPDDGTGFDLLMDEDLAERRARRRARSAQGGPPQQRRR